MGAEKMQTKRIHRWLNEHSYWAKGIPLETVETSIRHSCCVGAFLKEEQIGFARLVTDYATFAYLADVYVEEAHRGLGLSHAMLHELMEAPFVKGLRKILLSTLDAQTLYLKHGFQVLKNPERVMEITRFHAYDSKSS